MNNPSLFSTQETFCTRCGEQTQAGANFCPRCAMPKNPQPQFVAFSSAASSSATKKVGVLLGVGILFVPYIFSWFTLRKGHTTLAKAVSFGWLGVVVLTLAFSPKESRQPYAAMDQGAPTSSTQTAFAAAPVESPKEAALRQLKIDFKWGKGGFDSVMIADFTIQNPSTHTVKDLEVKCTHSANSGTEIDSNRRTIYETVPAKGKKVIKDFNMGFIHSQVSKSSCEVTDLEVVQ